MVTVPDTAIVGDPGHVTDHNTIVTAISAIIPQNDNRAVGQDELVYNIKNWGATGGTVDVTSIAAGAGRRYFCDGTDWYSV